jgi:type IV secretion system protein VirD4
MITWLFRVGRALRNMLMAAVRDPIWAIICIVMAPFRAWNHVLWTLVAFALTTVGMIIISLVAEHFLAPHGHNLLLDNVLGVIMLVVVLGVVLRMITTPLLQHFDYPSAGTAETHGSARFATAKETAPLTRTGDGLLIGRDGKTRKLLRYDGPAHLLTMAPTRSGKGVGTIIPNLLTQRRSIVCIDPKGENARITARARESFGAVYILDPFGITGEPSAAYNPFDSLAPQSPDIAEEAAQLADALVYDEPGTGGEAHWNEEAKALVAGIILYIAETEPPHRRNLSTLREYLTLAPDTFLELLEAMQSITACHGLIRRAANRHMGKSDREAAGVLSSAQRHTHFLDSPRMGQVLGASDFSFRDLKRSTATVFLVLPPDRLGTYARWLRLLVTQSLNDMARGPRNAPFPVLYLLDEFASLGYLAAVERAMGLMAGYGVQLWPILQDIHQLKAVYGQKAGTFLSNAGVLQVFGVNDHESARMVSDLLGQETVVFQTMARNLDSEQSGISYSQHNTGRPLMTADEVRTMPEHVELLFIAQQKPVAAVKLRYYADPEFKGTFDAA